jgi:hypothetical protein
MRGPDGIGQTFLLAWPLQPFEDGVWVFDRFLDESCVFKFPFGTVQLKDVEFGPIHEETRSVPAVGVTSLTDRQLVYGNRHGFPVWSF